LKLQLRRPSKVIAKRHARRSAKIRMRANRAPNVIA